jgi:DNA repair photolyase
MRYKQIKSDSVINTITKKDTLFKGKYTIDSYQNCEYGCKYCDSSFEKTIYIKANSEEILKKEIKQIEKGMIIVGSVHDPYQKADENYKITRKLLKIILKKNFPCHILTKSNLILRDIDILSKINNCIVTISLTSMNKSIANIFEKDVPSPKVRLQTIRKLSKSGITAGIAQIPILPYITEIEIEDIIKSAKKHGAYHFLYKYLELKGDQRYSFFNIVKYHYPDLIKKYQKLYFNNYLPDNNYSLKTKEKINKFCKIYKLNNKL